MSETEIFSPSKQNIAPPPLQVEWMTPKHNMHEDITLRLKYSSLSDCLASENSVRYIFQIAF